MRENMWNLAKYAAYMLHMPLICSIFFCIFPANANLSDGES